MRISYFWKSSVNFFSQSGAVTGNGLVVRRLLWSKGLRAFADGYVSLLLPMYLLSLGMSPLDVGVIATSTLLGSGALTLIVGIQAYRFELRTLLLMAAMLMTATGLGFATVTDFWPLLAVSYTHLTLPTTPYV